MNALILAAGQGTRLRRLTVTRPKPLLPIAGKPLLHHTVAWLAAHGIRNIAINIHHHPEAITASLGDGSAFGVSIRYSYEKELLGTAGAAKRLADFFDQDFVTIYGDVLTNIDLTRLLDLHQKRPLRGGERPAMTLALYRVPDPTQCGVVELDPEGRVSRFIEKPAADQIFTDLAFSGVMVCKPAVLDYIPADRVFDFGHNLIPTLLNNGAPIYAEAVAAHEYVVDIGTLTGYFNALQTYQLANARAKARVEVKVLEL